MVEELVEGGLTRLAVFYYAQLPAEWGRSARARQRHRHRLPGGRLRGDRRGAAGRTIARIQGAGVRSSRRREGHHRSTSRSAPYNVMANHDVATAAKGRRPVRPITCQGRGEDLPAGKKATTLSATFGGGRTRRRASTRTAATSTPTAMRPPTTSSPPTPCSCCGSRRSDAGYLDPAGNPVPETKLVGSGPAPAVPRWPGGPGSWTKPALDGEITRCAREEGDLPVRPVAHLDRAGPVASGNVTWHK
ncbi:MAG: hypothetical protein R2734_08685 [Nocardioides sp.]